MTRKPQYLQQAQQAMQKYGQTGSLSLAQGEVLPAGSPSIMHTKNKKHVTLTFDL